MSEEIKKVGAVDEQEEQENSDTLPVKEMAEELDVEFLPSGQIEDKAYAKALAYAQRLYKEEPEVFDKEIMYVEQVKKEKGLVKSFENLTLNQLIVQILIPLLVHIKKNRIDNLTKLYGKPPQNFNLKWPIFIGILGGPSTGKTTTAEHGGINVVEKIDLGHMVIIPTDGFLVGTIEERKKMEKENPGEPCHKYYDFTPLETLIRDLRDWKPGKFQGLKIPVRGKDGSVAYEKTLRPPKVIIVEGDKPTPYDEQLFLEACLYLYINPINRLALRILRDMKLRGYESPEEVARNFIARQRNMFEATLPLSDKAQTIIDVRVEMAGEEKKYLYDIYMNEKTKLIL